MTESAQKWLVGAGLALMFWWGLRGPRGALAAPLELDEEDYELLTGRQDDFERRWQLMMQHLRKRGRLPTGRKEKAAKPLKAPKKRLTPEERTARKREYARKYRQGEKFKKWLKAYRQTAKFKEYQYKATRAYRKSEGYKRKQLAKGVKVRERILGPEERYIRKRDKARERRKQEEWTKEVRFPGGIHTPEQKAAYIERLKKRRERTLIKWEQERGKPSHG